MFSLAPIKYAEVLSQKGGPIERIEYADGQLMGWPCVHAAAYLRKGLFPESVRSQICTPQPDGVGSHKHTQIACHMAVSEALERWAIYHCRAFPERTYCGMDFDTTSNGFAAFPGLFKRQARKAAFRESIERHCLIAWWEGFLRHQSLPDPQTGVRAIQLDNPFSNHAVVVIWGMHGMRHSYAFGAGDSLNHAIWRASVEMDRSRLLLDRISEQKALRLNKPLADLYERRIDFFSMEAGFSLFLNRLEATMHPQPARMRLLFDGPVSGPWERYASVWRTVIEPCSWEYLSDRRDYFFW